MHHASPSKNIITRKHQRDNYSIDAILTQTQILKDTSYAASLKATNETHNWEWANYVSTIKSIYEENAPHQSNASVNYR